MWAGCHRAVPAVIVTVLVAGCGGSSAPSRADDGKDVDKICATLEARVDAIQRNTPTTTDQLIAFADDLGQASRVDALARAAGARGCAT
jgi:hypothetical protein